MKKRSQISAWKYAVYQITNRFNRLLRNILEKINLPQKEIWELQYLKGDWNYLKNFEQLARYSMIVGYINELKKGGAILDVGCGEGVLQEKIGEMNYSKYVGIDISDHVINKALKKNNEKTIFQVADTLTYEPDQKFDVIVFNEILYYFSKKQILELLKKYQNFLKKEGIIIVSMYQNEENETIWNLI
ncbi:MAG: class I SAM-dependent methyltransferase, partial [Candidatus Helarchaeota archaeon]